MAHSLSAKKRIRQSAKRNAQNRARRAVVKSQIREVKDAIVHGDAAKAKTEALAAVKLLDRESARGLMHKNQAARRKSRLAKKLKAMGAGK